MYKKKFKQLKLVGMLLLIVFSAFSIIFFITQIQASSIPMHIIWNKVTVTDDYDPGTGKGKFKIQIKYNDGQNWRVQHSITHECYPGTYYPQITFTLDEEVLVGTYVYLRLLEDDFFSDDQIIKPYVENSGHDINNGNWYCKFYVGTTFEQYSAYDYNTNGDKMWVTFYNLEA